MPPLAMSAWQGEAPPNGPSGARTVGRTLVGLGLLGAALGAVAVAGGSRSQGLPGSDVTFVIAVGGGGLASLALGAVVLAVAD